MIIHNTRIIHIDDDSVVYGKELKTRIIHIDDDSVVYGKNLRLESFI